MIFRVDAAYLAPQPRCQLQCVLNSAVHNTLPFLSKRTDALYYYGLLLWSCSFDL